MQTWNQFSISKYNGQDIVVRHKNIYSVEITTLITTFDEDVITNAIHDIVNGLIPVGNTLSLSYTDIIIGLSTQGILNIDKLEITITSFDKGIKHQEFLSEAGDVISIDKTISTFRIF